MRRLATALLMAGAWWVGAATAAVPSPAGAAPQPPPSWRFVGLPKQTLPRTQFSVVDVDGRRALRIESAGSYGNLVHAVAGRGDTLSWSWRIEQPIEGADLRSKAGDDSALKVCAMFDLPLDALSLWERQKMWLARTLSGEHIPAATLCYVWDPSLPAGSLLPNAYTQRVRWIVLQGSGAMLGQWQREQRDLHADFKRAFGDESVVVPPLIAIGIGADADNTGGRALAFLTDLELKP